MHVSTAAESEAHWYGNEHEKYAVQLEREDGAMLGQ